ncbi:hypothetical protein WI26_07495 [Burkholderia diffusa]|nr:hypothetical protein WI26_07495 [Burkholderia diffusa]
MEPLLGPVDLRAWFDPTGICCMQEMQSCEDCPADAPWIHGPTTEYAEDGTGYRSPEIDWVIVGGESGPGARPMHPDWACSLHDQCVTYGVPFLFKQWGEWVPMMGHAEGVRVRGGKFTHGDGTIMGNADKHAAGRLFEGLTHDEFPEVPQCRS